MQMPAGASVLHQSCSQSWAPVARAPSREKGTTTASAAAAAVTADATAPTTTLGGGPWRRRRVRAGVASVACAAPRQDERATVTGMDYTQ